MSHHAAKADRTSGSRTARMVGYVGLPLLALAVAVAAPHIYRRWFLPDDSGPSFQAQVVATRVVNDGTLDNPWGTSFLYRVDVEAAWQDGASRHHGWIPTTKTSRDRVWLALWASQQGARCIVRQSPNDPSQRLAFFR